MKKIAIVFLLVFLLLINIFAVSALTSSEAKKDWLDKKTKSKAAQTTHQDAKIKYAANKSVENKKEVLDTGKVLLKAALDEVEAWLKWKKTDAQENTQISKELKNQVIKDVDTNLAKLPALKIEIDNVKTNLELGLVTLKMVGKYFELLSDVARNVGAIWVEIGETQTTKVADYESKLRAAANGNSGVLAKLDLAKDEISTAEKNIAQAKETYKKVKMPGQPLIKFSEGNNYLKAAKVNLISAHMYLNQAYFKINGGN